MTKIQQYKEEYNKKVKEVAENPDLIAYLKIISELAKKIQRKHHDRRKGLMVEGTEICPLCNHTIYYSIHSNDHLWMRCKTKNCINVTE